MRRNQHGGLVTGVKLRRRRKTLNWPDWWGPRVSEKKKEKSVPVRKGKLGRELKLVLA
jgi:hypothetical protein